MEDKDQEPVLFCSVLHIASTGTPREHHDLYFIAGKLRMLQV